MLGVIFACSFERSTMAVSGLAIANALGLRLALLTYGEEKHCLLVWNLCCPNDF